jgi:hypothetical protein
LNDDDDGDFHILIPRFREFTPLFVRKRDHYRQSSSCEEKGYGEESRVRRNVLIILLI